MDISGRVKSRTESRNRKKNTTRLRVAIYKKFTYLQAFQVSKISALSQSSKTYVVYARSSPRSLTLLQQRLLLSIPGCNRIVSAVPVIINHPVIHDMPLATFGGARIATQLYWPPATGKAEQISANE